MNLFKLELWEQFVASKDFKDIYVYIEKEYEVFKVYFQNMFEKIANSPKIRNMQLDTETR